MKFELPIVFLCLFSSVDYGSAIDILQQQVFQSSDCGGDVLFTVPSVAANICLSNFTGSGTSTMFTCSPVEHQVFATGDCSGEASSTQNVAGCITAGGGSLIMNCESVADNRVARILVGPTCGMDGKLSAKEGETYPITDICIRTSLEEISYKLTVEDENVLALRVFRESGNCEGDSTVTALEIGVCKEGISAIITGVKLGEVAIQVLSAKQGTSLGNNAIIDSTDRFFLIVAMLAALMAMF